MGYFHNFVTILALTNEYSWLIFTAIVIPFRISFYDIDDITWLVINLFIDASFMIDTILNFFMAYFDVHEDIVDDRKKIAISYLKGWFMVDITSSLPISEIMNTGT